MVRIRVSVRAEELGLGRVDGVVNLVNNNHVTHRCE